MDGVHSAWIPLVPGLFEGRSLTFSLGAVDKVHERSRIVRKSRDVA